MAPQEPDQIQSDETMGFMALQGGGTTIIRSSEKPGRSISSEGGTAPPSAMPSGDVLFEGDMPSLESVLKHYKIMYAVLEKPVPGVSDPPRPRSMGPQPTVSGLRVMFATAIATSVLLAGLLMMIGAVVRTPIVPNPYIALALILGGSGLVATVYAALKHPQ